jgi:uncharacterized protein YqjF (DUF2071 family)
MKPLLTAEWTNLVVATFETEKKFLEKFLPDKTELNDWNGKYFMSLVGFMFSKPSLWGIPSPIYRQFEEINLRFYVKNKEGTKKAVVFIKEIAPSYPIGFIAKCLYHENFIALPMKHSDQINNLKRNTEYYWKINNDWNFLKMETDLHPAIASADKLETFIADHYWGYTKSADKTFEFEIQHRPWNVYPSHSFEMNIDAKRLYGEGFVEYLSQKPISAFFMDGSLTKVSSPVLL